MATTLHVWSDNGLMCTSSGERGSSADYQPGYPIDLRRADQVASALKSPNRDFEQAAARVVARLTGERVVLQDDGSRDRMPDIRIEYTGSDPGYVEVWTDTDPGYARTWSRLTGRGQQMPAELPSSTLRRNWFVTVSATCELRYLDQQLEPLLARLEADGQVFECVEGEESLRLDPSATVARLLDLGVVELSSVPSGPGQQAVSRLYTTGIVGPIVIRWPVVLDWISDTLASPRFADVRTKLDLTGADQRHVFIGVTFTSPGDVYFALDLREHSLPPDPPTLPNEITHLWLMHAPFPDRCLVWSPDRGWFDPVWHWATD